MTACEWWLAVSCEREGHNVVEGVPLGGDGPVRLSVCSVHFGDARSQGWKVVFP
jgi:hypothetical protein